MRKFISVSEAAKIIGVSPQTLRRWDREGRLVADDRTAGNQRRYDITKLKPNAYRVEESKAVRTICYARVSSHDQKQDLIRQVALLEKYCAANGWTYEVIQDLGSGMNYNKSGLKQLLNDIIMGNIGRLVLSHKDRLLRFGSELIFTLCELHQVEVVIINQGEKPSFEEELAQDVLEIITVFSARLYGSRSGRHKKILSNLQDCLDESGNGKHSSNKTTVSR